MYVTTDDNGLVIKQPTVIHNHAIHVGRAEAPVVRSNILTEAERRPEATPAALLNEFVTPAVALSLGDEKQLTEPFQRLQDNISSSIPSTANMKHCIYVLSKVHICILCCMLCVLIAR